MYAVLVHPAQLDLQQKAAPQARRAHFVLFYTAEGNDLRAHQRVHSICSQVNSAFQQQLPVRTEESKGLSALFEASGPGKGSEEGMLYLNEPELISSQHIAVWKRFGSCLVTLVCNEHENTLLALIACTTFATTLQQHFKSTTLFNDAKDLITHADDVVAFAEQLFPHGQILAITPVFIKHAKRTVDQLKM